MLPADLFVITDCIDNSSVIYTVEDLKNLITLVETQYSWKIHIIVIKSTHSLSNHLSLEKGSILTLHKPRKSVELPIISELHL